MPRAAVLTGDLNMDESGNKKGLSYDKAEAFYGIRLQLPHDVALRQAARSMLAMWQAAHNTDFYITKYGTKALEQLQNLMSQFALGLRRLELEEKEGHDHKDEPKRKARTITLRLANAANRATWASCCEMACLFARRRMPEKLTFLGLFTLVAWHTGATHVSVSSITMFPSCWILLMLTSRRRQCRH